MEHPTLLTLTIPNVGTLKKTTFAQIRSWWKEFFRANKKHLRGGFYSIEATYNREDKTWHPHLHVLFDASHAYQGMGICNSCKSKGRRGHGQQRVGLSVDCTCPFFIAKMLVEYSWLRITSPDARKLYKRNSFKSWLRDTFTHADDLDWNRRFRRVVDVRAVKGENAVYEVIKYVSKTNRFLDIPEAVEQFLRAVRGVRVIQTFGSFYNFKLEVPITKAEVEELAAVGIDAPVAGVESFLHCDCGSNKFLKIGIVGMADVEMDESGRWVLRPSSEQRGCRSSGVPGRGREWDLSSAESQTLSGTIAT
jgi:hypothetical protein